MLRMCRPTLYKGSLLYWTLYFVSTKSLQRSNTKVYMRHLLSRSGVTGWREFLVTNSVSLFTKRARFTTNTHESGHILVKPLHHTFVQYINPWWIKLFIHVKVTCFFNFSDVEEPIIIFNIICICLTYRSKDTFKPSPWHILINDVNRTSRHGRICCWPPVPPVRNSDPSTHV